MKKLLFVLMFTLVSASASAGFMVEPYLGYKLGSATLGTDKYSTNSVMYGARAGFQQMGLFIAADYSLASYDTERTLLIGTVTTAKTSQNQFGITLGYELPILLRVYGTYFLSAHNEFTSTSPVVKYRGSGFALGAGMTMLPFIKVNAELRKLSYDEADTGTGYKTLATKYEPTEIFISLSVPFSI